MATLNGLPVSYDANGNITGEYGYQGYTYNNANRLASSTITAGSQTMVVGSYSYNAFGRRVINNTETHYLYTPDGKYLVKPVWGNGTVPFQRSEYIYLDNIPVAQVYESLNSNGTVASTTLTYVLADHLGTPRLMMDTTKKVVWRWEGDAFGQSFPIQSTDSTTGLYDFLDLRFPGQMADNGNTSYYNINRYYDPLVGRYTQSDPIGLWGSINRYTYVDANPVNLFDVYGFAKNCPECKQSYFDCLVNCITSHDPLNSLDKLALTGIGGTFPKEWIGLPRGLGGASPLTTVPSTIVHGAGGGGAGTVGGAVRGAGRLASPIWIGYGLYLFGIESWCTYECYNDNCAF
jgi:RHS repeat-associated protein